MFIYFRFAHCCQIVPGAENCLIAVKELHYVNT